MFHDDFIYSFTPDISLAPLQVHHYSKAFPTVGISTPKASASEGLAQGPYVAARVRPSEPTIEPPCPTMCTGLMLKHSVHSIRLTESTLCFNINPMTIFSEQNLFFFGQSIIHSCQEPLLLHSRVEIQAPFVCLILHLHLLSKDQGFNSKN